MFDFINRYVNKTTALQFFQLFRFGIVFLISVSLAKSKLSISEIGHYERLLFFTGAVSFFWVSGLIQALLPLYQNNKAFRNLTGPKSPEFFNVTVLLTALSCISFVFVFIFHQISRNQEISELSYHFWLYLYILFNAPTLLIEYIYLLLNKPWSIIRYGLISFIIQLLLVGSPALLGFSVHWCMAGLMVTVLIRWIWLIFLLQKTSSFQLSLPFIREHLKLGYPLILSLLLAGSAQYIDGFLVNWFYDPSSFAIFRFGARELPLAVLMANAFDSSFSPEFRKTSLNEILDRIKKKSLKLMHVLFPITFILLITSQWIYPLIFNPNFKTSAGIFNIYLLLIISRMVFPQTIMIGTKNTSYIPMASACEIIIHVSLSLVFIKLWGIAGVAAATVISSFSEKILLMIFAYHRLKIKPFQYVPFPELITYGCITLLIYGLVTFTPF